MSSRAPVRAAALSLGFKFQPVYAVYLNLIEPCWKVLPSLALKRRRFEIWEQGCEAVGLAACWMSIAILCWGDGGAASPVAPGHCIVALIYPSNSLLLPLLVGAGGSSPQCRPAP